MRANVIPLLGQGQQPQGEVRKACENTKHKIIIKNLWSLYGYWLHLQLPSDSTDLIHILKLLCQDQRIAWMGRVSQEQEKMSPWSNSVPSQSSQSQAAAPSGPFHSLHHTSQCPSAFESRMPPSVAMASSEKWIIFTLCLRMPWVSTPCSSGQLFVISKPIFLFFLY